MSKSSIDKEGNVEMIFSSEMKFPDNWVEMSQKVARRARLM